MKNILVFSALLMMGQQGISQAPKKVDVFAGFTDEQRAVATLNSITSLKEFTKCSKEGWKIPSLCVGNAVAIARDIQEVWAERPALLDKTDWPIITASAQLILDPVQAKYSGNEHVKPCGPDNHDDACFDPKARHITNRIYGVSKERCEHDEGVACEELQPCIVDQYMTYEKCRRWVPIGKPVFMDETQQEQEKPLIGNSVIATSPVSTTWTQPPAEVVLSNAEIKDGRKVYTLSMLPDWTCVPQSNSAYYGNPLHDSPQTLVTITCVKSDAPEHKEVK